jgi:clan AA aspartic protease (TIGR02281 family)
MRSKNRLLMLTLSSAFLIIAWTCGSSLAVDIKQLPSNECSEAIDFFNKMIKASKNSFIVKMAREGLFNLQQPSTRMQPTCHVPTASVSKAGDLRKNIIEIKLLPQYDNTYTVPAIVNRQHLATFLVDTGASYTVITPKMARQLGLSFRKILTTVPITTANGTINAPLVMLKQLTLGKLNVENVEAIVADLGDTSQISGLLGMNFFHGMEFAFKQNCLFISRQ